MSAQIAFGSGMCPSVHEVLKLLLMEKYSCMDRLPHEMWHHPMQSRIQRFCLQSLPTSSARSPLTRDLSGLGFVELQNRHVFTTC